MQMVAQTIAEVNYYLNNPDLGGDALIKKSTQKADGDNAITSFEVEVPVAGEYYANFWMFPTKLKDGTLANYAVSVNGSILKDKIVPTIGDWHDATLSGNRKISLNKGVNTIAVIGAVPDIPNVEHIRLSSNIQEAIIDATKYRDYKSEVEEISAMNATRKNLLLQDLKRDTLSFSGTSRLSTVESVAPTIVDSPLYNYEYALNLMVDYTFYKTVFFTQGQQIFIETNGVNYFAHILELFCVSVPETFSWAVESDGDGIASINVTIPATGMYYVRVRSYQNGHNGLCNLNINNENFYENVPVYSIGVRCNQGTDKVYNTFTTNSTTDTRIWIEEESYIPGKIHTFNDDYNGTGDFDWGTCSRIKKQYTREVNAVLLSSYASSDPRGRCDLYMKCMESDLPEYFGNLEEDDAIQSAPASTQYNCISWSGAITSYWEWPPYETSSFYSPNPLTAFDNFYASRGLTRSGATANNGVVALWAYVDANGNRYYTHGSVKNGADNNVHGYDWESKAGQLMRSFHPRDAVGGDYNYGEIVEYYIKNTASTASLMTLEEEIANGTTRVEYIDLTSEEKEYLSENINSISSDVMQQFNALYNSWKNIVSNTKHSNPYHIANCEEYRNVLAFCSSHDELLYALYNKVGEGELAAMILVGDLTFEDNQSVLENIRESASESTTRSGIKTIRPLQSNNIAYIKELLVLENVSLAKSRKQVGGETGVSYSNFKEFEVSASHVNFSLNSSAYVSLILLDLSGKTICTIIDNKLLDTGNHSYTLPEMKNDVYLVQLIIDGRVNIKKVFNQ